MANMKCPCCGSEEIYRFQRDIDWGGGIHYDTVNGDDACYKEENCDVPNVDVFHCRNCNAFFSLEVVTTFVEAIPVYVLEDAIHNLEKHVQWLTKHYKESCVTAQTRVMQASYKEMATKIPDYFPELERKYAEISQFTEQITLLSHILEKHKKEGKAAQQEVHCGECENLTFSDCYGECKIGEKGIVKPNDSCPKGKRRH